MRLNALVEDDVLRRVEYQQHPVRYEYRLTPKGRDAYPILAAMAAWGDRWLVGGEGTPLVLHHTACEHDMHAVVVCSECDEPIDVREMRAKRGPGAADLSIIPRRTRRPTSAGREFLEQRACPRPRGRAVGTDRERRRPDIGRARIEQLGDLRSHARLVTDDRRGSAGPSTAPSCRIRR